MDMLIFSYAAPILVNIEYVQGSHTEKTTMEKVIYSNIFGCVCNRQFAYHVLIPLQNDVVIGRIPIMLRSCRCVLYGKDEAELARLGISM